MDEAKVTAVADVLREFAVSSPSHDTDSIARQIVHTLDGGTAEADAGDDETATDDAAADASAEGNGDATASDGGTDATTETGAPNA